MTDGVAFPQTETLTLETGKAFFKAQTYTGVAYQADTGQIVGLYILHLNNVGRCGHICNTSYAVDSHFSGQHIGEKLVRRSMTTAKKLRFRILQFNAVVKSNHVALTLYPKLVFHQLGTIPTYFSIKSILILPLC